MKDKLTKEEVLHVAYLARIALTDEEVERFQVQLKELFDEVSKITTIEGYDDEMMFTVVEEEPSLREDEIKPMLNPKDAMREAKKTNGNFVEVPVMIND